MILSTGFWSLGKLGRSGRFSFLRMRSVSSALRLEKSFSTSLICWSLKHPLRSVVYIYVFFCVISVSWMCLFGCISWFYVALQLFLMNVDGCLKFCVFWSFVPQYFNLLFAMLMLGWNWRISVFYMFWEFRVDQYYCPEKLEWQ